MYSDNEDLSFYYPKEGTNIFVDAMCIPKGARNKDIAEMYINFMLSVDPNDPETSPAIANAEYIGYASPNSAVIESDEYIEAMSEYAYEGKNGEGAYDLLYNYLPENVNAGYDALYPDAISPACYRTFDPTIQTHVNTLWEDLKISGSTELWVHVTSIAIVVAVVAYAAYSTYIKKKRSRDYRMRDRQKMLERKTKNITKES